MRRALTHRSANKLNNERLEFLGDSLLGFIIAESLCLIHLDASEGELSRLRSSLVNKDNLAQIARTLQLGDFIGLGAGEAKTGGRERDSILADAVEAVIAAIYLDGGMENCKKVVEHWNADKLTANDPKQGQKDHKTRLQELMQSKGAELPSYSVIATSGEAHEQTFLVECRAEGLDQPQKGSGRSKRIAEQIAAEKILIALGEG